MNKKPRNTDKTVVFILSGVRSGSHWLSYVLGSHAKAAYLGEYYRLFTKSNHVACRLCQAKGRAECEFLCGSQGIRKKNAHDFAFDRLQKPILIDCSKEIKWLKNFIHSKSYQIKIIHLLRDPRAWFASVRRRDKKASLREAMNYWVAVNLEISKAIHKFSLPSVSAIYDELCIEPKHFFKRVCAHIGMPFESGALEYWKKEHHGLGSGSGSFNNLIKYNPASLVTGDDKFYAKHARKVFYDSRWTKELSSSERKAIEGMEKVEKYLSFHSRSFSFFDDLRARQKAPGLNHK